MKVKSLMYEHVVLALKTLQIRRTRLPRSNVALRLLVPLSKQLKTPRSLLVNLPRLLTLGTLLLRLTRRSIAARKPTSANLLLLNRRQISVTRKNSSNHYGTS
jgi:hypothetical protein